MKLTAETRTVFGKKVAQLRADGIVPGELYGHGVDNLHLSLVRKDLRKALTTAGKTDLIDIEVDGKSYPVLAHEWTKDPHTGHLLHVDFYKVKKGEKVTVTIPLNFVGEAPAEKAGLGLLNHNLTEIEVEGTPGKLPHEIEVSLESLNEVGDSIHVSDLKLGNDAEAQTDSALVIVSISELIKEEEPEEEEVDLDAVEVEGEKKEEEGSEEA